MRCVISTDLLRAQLLLPPTLRACCPTISLYSIALLIRKLRMWHHPPRSHLCPSSSLGPFHSSQICVAKREPGKAEPSGLSRFSSQNLSISQQNAHFFQASAGCGGRHGGNFGRQRKGRCIRNFWRNAAWLWPQEGIVRSEARLHSGAEGLLWRTRRQGQHRGEKGYSEGDRGVRGLAVSLTPAPNAPHFARRGERCDDSVATAVKRRCQTTPKAASP